MNKLKTGICALLVSANCAWAAMPLTPKAIAVQSMMDIFSYRDATAVDRYFGAPYIQHNLAIGDGLDNLRALAGRAVQYPGGNTNIYRAVADGELVVLHSVYEGIPRFEGKAMVAFDMFRIRDGRIYEHWDALTPALGSNAGGHTQTDGAAVIADGDKTESNRSVARRFVEQVLVAGKRAELPQFIDAARYVEHSARAEDGLLAGSSSRQTGKLHRVIAEGNFVVTQSEGNYGGKPAALYDLFRLANGKIVEHWDVLAPLLPREKWAHQNGAF